jgi:4-hydroxybenzoate polyprenyltransferase
VLVRWRSWWFNKVPLSVTLLVLLLDGGRLSGRSALAAAAVVLAVCGAGNFGYALNDLYDVEEDAAAGRENAAAGRSRARVWAVVAASAVVAAAAAAVAAGRAGAAITAGELCLPLVYSVPPLRLKERGWLGVAADALAAHVYPAGLAVLAVERLGVGVGGGLVACVLVWGAAAGVRGILSHQLSTADRDARGGLETVVHRRGRARVERLVVAVPLPVELLAFAGAVVLARAGGTAFALLCAYVAYEALRAGLGGFTVRAFRPDGQRYLPFLEEGLYKAWGPLVLSLDAAVHDLRWLAVPPLYWLLFRRHLRSARKRIRAVALATGRAARAG